MAESGKKVEVRFGAFSCSVEGYDNPVEQMREVLMLMQRMIHETPALADHGPGFGDAEVARIEHALDRRAERDAGGSGVVVIRGPQGGPTQGPEAERDAGAGAEDAVTTAEIPPEGQALAESMFPTGFPPHDPAEAAAPDAGQPEQESATSPAPGSQEAAGDEPESEAPGYAGEERDPSVEPAGTAGHAPEDAAPDDRAADEVGHDEAANYDAASHEADPKPPATEEPLSSDADAAPAAAIYSAPAAAMAEAAFAADLASTDEDPTGSAANGGAALAGLVDGISGGDTDGAAADRQPRFADRTGTEEQAQAADDLSRAAQPFGETPAASSGPEEANHLWAPTAAPSAGGEQPGTDAADAAEVTQAAPAERPNHLWDTAAGPAAAERHGGEAAPGGRPAFADPRDAPDGSAASDDPFRGDMPGADAVDRDAFARDEPLGEHEEPAFTEVPGRGPPGDNDSFPARQADHGDGVRTGRAADRGDHDAADEIIDARAIAQPATGAPEGHGPQYRDAGQAERPSGTEQRTNIIDAPQPQPAAPAFNIFASPDELYAAAAPENTSASPPEATAPTAADNIFASPPEATAPTAADNIFASPPDVAAPTAADNIFASPPDVAAATPPENIFAPPAADPTRRSGQASRLFARPMGERVSRGAPEAAPGFAGPAPDTAGRDSVAADPTPAHAAPDRGRDDEPRGSENIFADPHPARRPSSTEPKPGAPDRLEPEDAASDAETAWRAHMGDAGTAGDDGSADGSGRPRTDHLGTLGDDQRDIHGPSHDGQGRDGAGHDGGGGGAGPESGLREPPRPEPVRRDEERNRFSALLARLGGRRASPDAGVERRPAPHDAADDAAAASGDASPADLAERAGATSVADLLAVAAAWLTLVEGKPRFTRREVMETFERLPGDHPRNLEARIKGFGKLVRSSTLILVDDGVFAMAQAERDRYQAMIDSD